MCRQRRAIASDLLAARNMKHFTLELGGKSPMVVLDDADLDITIPGAAIGIFANHGQKDRKSVV